MTWSDELGGELIPPESWPKVEPETYGRRPGWRRRKFWYVIDLDGQDVSGTKSYVRSKSIDTVIWKLLMPSTLERMAYDGNSREWRRLYGYGFRCVARTRDDEDCVRHDRRLGSRWGRQQIRENRTMQHS